MSKTPIHTRHKTVAAQRNTRSASKAAPSVRYDLLKNILDHVADPIFVKDRDHRIIYGNHALSRIMGIPEKDYIGKNDRDLFPKEQVDVFWQKDNHVFETGEVDLNEEYLTDSHGKRHILSTKKTLCSMAGHDPVIVGITRDITAFKEIEHMKNEFIAMISHELKTPLTSIHASLMLLASNEVCNLPDAAKNIVKIAHKNSERLVKLVNELLHIEKIETGMLCPEIKRVAVAEFLTQALEENSAYGKKYGVTFEIGNASEDYTILADADCLMQILTNLLSNAAKFSSRGAKVQVGATPQPNHQVRLEVRDSGIGIPKHFHSKIFDKFTQVDTSVTRQQGGTGLGLNITKKLVEAMGGSISFQSTLGKGTVFYVDLPAAPAAAKTTRRRRYAN